MFIFYFTEIHVKKQYVVWERSFNFWHNWGSIFRYLYLGYNVCKNYNETIAWLLFCFLKLLSHKITYFLKIIQNVIFLKMTVVLDREILKVISETFLKFIKYIMNVDFEFILTVITDWCIFLKIFWGCPYRGKCIPFGKKWYVENGEVLRCVHVENKKRYFLESVTGGR